MLHNPFLLDMSTFKELVIKYDPVKKATFFVFMVGFQLPINQVLVLEDRTLHCNFPSRLYRNSKFNVLANFNFVLPTS